MTQPWENKEIGRSDGAVFHAPVTPHDTNPLDPVPRALWCNEAGSLTVVDRAGTEATYTVLAGSLLPIDAVIVKTGGITNIVAMW